MPQELRWYWFGPNINIKCLKISTPATPHWPVFTFLPACTFIKRSYFYQPLLVGLMDTDFALKDKA